MTSKRKKWFIILAPVCGSMVLILALLAGSWAMFGSPGTGIRYLQGERLLVTPTRLSAGQGSQGTREIVRIVVRNHTGSDVTLLGGQASCSRCLTLSNLPQTIPTGQILELEIEVKFLGQSGPFVQEYVLFTSYPACPQLRVAISGAVTEQPAGQ